jgi:hypothetical protein
MNRHGVPVTVTRGPGGAGGIEIGSGSASSGIVPGSPRLQAAQRVCQKLLPGGGPKQLTPAQQAESTRSELAFAECMRKHGYPGFPDPDSQGVLNLSGIDPRSAQFQSSMKSCRPQGGVIAIRARATS